MNKIVKTSLFKNVRNKLDIFVFVLNEFTYPEITEHSDKTQEVYNKIHQYIVTEKHFLDKNITMNIIVRQCNVGKKLLNKVLRLKDDVAFHGYINKQRVIYASTLLLDPSNKLIEVVASESCFNNSRTFVRNFKAVYHMTPSEFRRSHWIERISEALWIKEVLILLINSSSIGQKRFCPKVASICLLHALFLLACFLFLLFLCIRDK